MNRLDECVFMQVYMGLFLQRYALHVVLIVTNVGYYTMLCV